MSKKIIILTPSHPQNRGIMIMFHAPWCGHCKAFKPEYARASSALRENESGVVLAAVDCDKFDDLCHQMEVTGFPSIHWYHRPPALDEPPSLGSSHAANRQGNSRKGKGKDKPVMPEKVRLVRGAKVCRVGDFFLNF